MGELGVVSRAPVAGELGIVSWALVAAALLLFVVAVRLVFRGGREAQSGGRERLGCGFGVLAFLLWGYAFGLLLDSTWNGLRLALGLLLVLPVVQAVARPESARLGRAAVALIVAVVAAGPVLVGLWQRAHPSESDAVVAEMRAGLEELRGTLEALERHAGTLRTDRAALRRDIAGLGHADFDALAADPVAFEKLRELGEIEDLLAKADARAATLRARIPELEGELRRLERAVDAEESLYGAELERDAVEALRALLAEDERPAGTTSVEEYAERKRLQALYEAEDF